MTLTDEQRKAYIDAGGVHCPFCGSSDIEGGFVETDAGRATQPISCLTCDQHWTDEYVLAAITPDEPT